MYDNTHNVYNSPYLDQALDMGHTPLSEKTCELIEDT